MKPRRRIKPISTRQAEKNKDYAKSKRIWKSAMIVLGLWKCNRCGGTPENSPHHMRGRLGALLCFHPLFIPLCRKCHDWVHQNPNDARKAKLLCEKGLWGVMPGEEPKRR